MNKIQLIDAETLYYKPLAHPRMLIDGILADGLAVMAGDSKIGKSWMVLWLCLQISKGEPVWGIPTRKTDVVYLALEDREWRIQHFGSIKKRQLLALLAVQLAIFQHTSHP